MHANETSNPAVIGQADRLAPDTSMGAVTLRVADLDAMTAYYRDAVTLTLLGQGDGQSILGRGSVPVVILEHAPELRHAGPRDAGLFHTAILSRPRRTWPPPSTGWHRATRGRSPAAPIIW